MSGPQRILVLARSISILGNFAAPVALSFAVLALTPGPEAASRLALVLVAAAVPQLLFLAVGGAAADRGHRRLLAVGGETGAALAEAASAALLLTHTATVGALAGLAAARGAFSATGTPAMRAFVADSVAGSGIAWRIRPQRPLLVYIVLYFLEIPLRLAWALLAPPPVLAVSAGAAGLSFAAASSLWQTVLATRIASQQLGTVAAADEAGGAVANPLAIALTAPLIALLGARTIMAGGLLWLVVSTTVLTVLTAIRDPTASDA